MTRLFLIIVLCSGLTVPGHTQSVSVWVDQLAALQTLQNTIRQGYLSVTTGLQTIGDIRSAEYTLHRSYFSSLDTLKPSISSDPKLQAMQRRLATLITRLRRSLDYWQNQPMLKP